MNKRVVVFVFVALIALLARVLFLDKYPAGIHGDEASTGLRALYIYDHGFIGFFDHDHSVGQWALAEYLTVPFVKLISDDFYSIRLPMALVGSFGLIVFYLILLKITGSTAIAFLGFLYQAVFFPHLHLSRLAITPVLADTLNLIGLYLFLHGRHSLSGVIFSLAGISYASGPFFPIAFLAAFTLVKRKLPVRCLIPFLVITSSIYIFELYEGRLTGRAKSVFDWEQIEARISAVFRYLLALFSYSYFDAVDGLGGAKIYSTVEFFCFVLGAVLAARRRHSLQIILLLASAGVLALSVYTVLSTDHGFFRRSLTAFSVLNLFLFTTASMIDGKTSKRIYFLTLCLAVANQIALSFKQAQSEPVRWVFAVELTQIRDLIKRYEDQIHSLGFKSARWSIRYETNRWFHRGTKNYENFEDLKDRLTKDYSILIFDDPAIMKYVRGRNYRCSKLNQSFRYCKNRYTQAVVNSKQ